MTHLDEGGVMAQQAEGAIVEAVLTESEISYEINEVSLTLASAVPVEVWQRERHQTSSREWVRIFAVLPSDGLP